MTNFEIARRYVGLKGVELAKLLEVSPQQLNGWINGTRVPTRANAETYAGKMGVDAAWLLGVPQTLPVWSPENATVHQCPIMHTQAIDGYGTMYIVYLEELERWLPVIAGEGVQFTPYDWQAGDNARTVEEIGMHRWVDQRNADAIMLDGLPRATM